MIPPSVIEYIKKYSLSHWQIESNKLNGIENVIIVPAISEYKNIINLLTSIVKMDSKYFDSTLVVFVINNIASSSIEIKIENKNTLSLLRSIVNKDLGTGITIVEKILSSGIKLGFIDASTIGNELPEKNGGVGLARKLGMDLALSILDFKSSNKKILVCLDADCTLEKNYLTEVVQNFNKRNLSAAVVNYKHKLSEDKNTNKAIICYEIFLRYYVLGLIYAKSDYAIHTIGSTMMCDYESYIKVEGMNKKKAAEDFYFLQKLAKNVQIEKISETTVYPSGRKSWRVPFGTGQRISRYLSNTQNEYLLYDPKTFHILKKWLEVFYSIVNVKADVYLNYAKIIDKYLFDFLIEQNFELSWNNIIVNSSSDKQIIIQKKRWFDGFRTLKLVHFLRDNSFPMKNMFNAIDEMLNLIGTSSYPARNDTSIPAIEVQEEYLKILRELT